ncbi:GNAT family N-acetyltransferase [Metasolibacillus sp. FSL H7-0170]|uniref:GNAT family N-acetyltransferase n=1 Tax=Metasolibacillus TaxID=2703677 RepID=UPI0007929CDC|nr:GNAT family N-acetyltransferase [Metasolibacillus fluoroglycofenilyticus]KYG90846.1 acetyltransferase [[Bacillus] sp. KCTC 13219]
MFEVHSAISEEQLQRAFDIRKKVFVEEQGVPIHLELDEYDKTSYHFIVTEGERTIAAARLREYEPLVGKVERVCVLNEYRGKRLGALLMEHIEQVAKEKNWKKLKLNAQSYAIPFYEKLQYTVTSPEFLDAGIPHRAMEKSI